MFECFSKRHLLVLVCALLVLTAGCTDAGSDGEAPIDEPDTAEAGIDADEEAGDGEGTTGGTESDTGETEETGGDDSGPDWAGSDDANEANGGGSADGPDETPDGSGGSDADSGETTATDDESSASDSDTEDANDEGSDGSDTEGSTDRGESDGESGADDETPTENSSDEETSEPPAFLGSDPSPAVLYEFPGHAGPSAGSPDVSDAEDFEAELAAQGVDVRSVEDGDALTVEYATSAEDGWEPAIDEMGAVSAAFWGLADSGHDASTVEATVTDDEGRTLYTYRIERAWLTEYLDSVEAIENGTATSPADPSEEYAETVWTTVDVEV